MYSARSPIRGAAVAGQFYPGSRDGLERAIRNSLGQGEVQKALGVMVPHAGYVYSGHVAGEVYSVVELPRRFVILGPNHTGLGAPVSIMASGAWRTPLGDAAIDSELAGDLLSMSSIVTDDESAHAHEHSIEVQLPFLQLLAGGVSFVPITMMVTGVDECRNVGIAVAAAIKAAADDVLVIASSDMTHYESRHAANEKDKLALDRVLDLDPEGLLDIVQRNRISMCGVAPAAAMLFACRELDATSAELVRYATSGDVTGDFSQVVGYAGVVIT